jgi:hypothetical protein
MKGVKPNFKPSKDMLKAIHASHGHKSGNGLSLSKVGGNRTTRKVQVTNPIFVQHKHARGTTIIAHNKKGDIHQIVHHKR